MKVRYDPEEDILYIIVKEGQIFDSREVAEDVRLEFNKDGEVAGIEITNASRNVARAIAKEITKEVKASARSA